MATAADSTTIRTLADLLERLGGVPLDRIRLHPAPGTATINDVIMVQEKEGTLCELVEGVLVEKTVGYNESRLAVVLGGLLHAFVASRNLGLVTGADGTMEIMPDLVRIPDVAFTDWDRLPGGEPPTSPVPRLAPTLAVEVLSISNTPGEMEVKREDYFDAGVVLVWEIDPRTRTAVVYSSVTDVIKLAADGVLDGGTVLPGFRLPLNELFAELDRKGPA
ncbi:MAG TPA: Uma2 family endonuclease [Pirellulales bacterium]|nr:Uma2 family endonuclease [Pirellulales bacterium]